MVQFELVLINNIFNCEYLIVFKLYIFVNIVNVISVDLMSWSTGLIKVGFAQLQTSWGFINAAPLHLSIVIIMLSSINMMQAAKEVQKLPSLSASYKKDVDQSVICHNFTFGNGKDEFYSPNYPNNYPNNTECEKVIRAPHGELIKIEFRDSFRLEDSPTCEYDYLEIRDGEYGYSKVLAKICGHNFPSDIISSDRYLYIRFVSDDTIEYSGFRAVYHFIPQPTSRPEPDEKCLFNRSGASGTIKNADIPERVINYTKIYEVPLDCIWNITIERGWKMYLQFKEYKLAMSNQCETNFIEIYGDKLNDRQFLQRFCGTQSEPKTSKGNNIYIRVFAKPEAFYPKFEVLYTAFREKSTIKESCQKNEFDCDDGTCIDLSLKCNKEDNCKYKYDEDKANTCLDVDGVREGVFKSEHMVIILVVFCALVIGMCSSIGISCWSKIQERTLRKREYKLRRSRDTSLEVGLDRTMTITSLDHHSDHEIIAPLGSSPRSRKQYMNTNTIIRSKSHDDENNSYGSDMEYNIYRKQPNGGPTMILDGCNKYSPEKQQIIHSPDSIPISSADCPLYYHQRDSIRSGSESPIPPPPPPPVLGHMRSRSRNQVTMPLDASKLDSIPVSSIDNQPPQHQVQHKIHHPECAQHQFNAIGVIRTNPEYSRSASVPLGPLAHVSVVDSGNKQIHNNDDDELSEDDKIVPLLTRPHRFRAEAIIEMSTSPLSSSTVHGRQRSFETTRSAPDVVIMR